MGESILKEDIYSLEDYRFRFINYLEVALKYVELRQDRVIVDRVDTLRRFGKTLGKSTVPIEESKKVLEAESILRRRYNMEPTIDGFDLAFLQCCTEYYLAMEGEDEARRILGDCARGIEESVRGVVPFWYDENPEEQRELLVDDGEKSIERIMFYLNSLKNYNKAPKPPAALEVSFKMAYGSLFHNIPFKI